MPLPYFLTTERIGFRCWMPEDAGLASALWGDPRVTALIGGPFTPQQVEARLRAEIACLEAHCVQYWPIFLLDSARFAGCSGLRPYRLEEEIYEIGFHLLPSCWGRGLAEEAARAVIGFAFERIRAKALFAGHHPRNSASQRVLEKLGFQFTHEEFYAPMGLKHVSYLLMAPR